MSLSTPSTSRPPKRPNLNDFDSYWVRDTDPPAQESFDFQVAQISDNYCRVCGDITANRYYGVVTCKNCETFFHSAVSGCSYSAFMQQSYVEFSPAAQKLRNCGISAASIRNDPAYQAPEQQRKANRTTIRCLSEFRRPCVLYPKTQMCQFCRFNKCVEVGLDVRKGWFPRILLGQAPDLPLLCQRQRTTDTPAEAMQEVDSNEAVSTMLHSFHQHCSYTTDKVNMMVFKYFPNKTSNTLDDNTEPNRLEIWELLSEFLDKDISATIQWIPSESIGNISDICAVLRRQLFPMMLIQWTRALTDRNGLQLHDGTILGRHKLRMAFGVALAENMLIFANDLRAQQFTDEELMMYACLVFLQPIQPDDPLRAELHEPDVFGEHYHRYYKWFMKYVFHHHFGIEKLNYAVTLLMPHLKAMNELFQYEVRPFLIQNKHHLLGKVPNGFYSIFVEPTHTPPLSPRGHVAQNGQNGQVAQVAQNGAVAQVAYSRHIAHDAQVARASPLAQAAQVVINLEDDDSDIEIIEEVHPEPAPAPQKPKRKRNKRKSTPEN